VGSNKNLKFRTGKQVLAGFCSVCGSWRGQLGLEPTWQMYVDHLVEIGREIKRVLRKDGSYYLVLGDTYFGSGGAGGDYNKGGMREGQPRYKQGKGSKCIVSKPKQKLLIPYRVAIALQEDGWICRNDITWHKPNAMPSSVRDRLTTTTERVFHLVKSPRYYYDLDAIRQPHLTQDNGKRNKHNSKFYSDSETKSPLLRHTGISLNPLGKNPGDVYLSPKYKKGTGHSNRQGLQRELSYHKKRVYEVVQVPIARYLKQYIKGHETELDEAFGCYRWRHWIRTDYSGACLPSPQDWIKLKNILGFGEEYDKIMTETTLVDNTIKFSNKGRNPGDFWPINTRPFKGAHFAVFPDTLIEPIIKSSCQKNGVVLDPMCGSGTTLIVAKRLGRNYLGCDINPNYIEMTKKRLAETEWPLDISNFKTL